MFTLVDDLERIHKFLDKVYILAQLGFMYLSLDVYSVLVKFYPYDK